MLTFPGAYKKGGTEVPPVWIVYPFTAPAVTPAMMCFWHVR